MRNLLSKFAPFVKKHKLLSILTMIIIVVCAWWAYVNFMPKPLGDKLEYLGKQDYGGIIFGDSQPYSVYYYGTDMTVKEVEEYFKGATVEYPSEDKGQYTDIWLTNGDKSTPVTYYEAAQAGFHKNTDKKYIISVRDDTYSTLLQSL